MEDMAIHMDIHMIMDTDILMVPIHMETMATLINTPTIMKLLHLLHLCQTTKKKQMAMLKTPKTRNPT